MKTVGNISRIARTAGTAVLRHTPKLRLLARKCYWTLEARRYEKLASRVSTEESLVFFEAFGGRSFSCSPRAIYFEMLAQDRFSNYRFVWSVRDIKNPANGKDLEHLANERTSLVVRGSKEYFEYLAKAKVIIINTRLPEYVFPKKDQIYVQCWHGTPLKRLGYDVKIETTNALNTTSELADRFGMDSKKWTYLLSPSPYTSLHLADAFGLPLDCRDGVIIEEGYPRNDELAASLRDGGEARRRITQELGLPQNKKVMLYAPTWRDDSYKAGVGYTFDYLIDFEKLKNALGSDWIVLFRPHYYIANEFDFSKYEGFVLDVSAWGNINDLYIASDALVTDYSSVMFDYSILHKPMFLFVPDYETYAQKIRGFYFDLKDVPGPLLNNTDALVQALNDLDAYWNHYRKNYDKFVSYFCPKDDGCASRRVIERVWGD